MLMSQLLQQPVTHFKFSHVEKVIIKREVYLYFETIDNIAVINNVPTTVEKGIIIQGNAIDDKDFKIEGIRYGRYASDFDRAIIHEGGIIEIYSFK